jgi:hypothetical protein
MPAKNLAGMKETIRNAVQNAGPAAGSQAATHDRTFLMGDQHELRKP